MFRILFLLLLLFITAISCGGYWIYKYQLIAPLPLYDDLHYTVPPNATLRLIPRHLLGFPWHVGKKERI